MFKSMLSILFLSLSICACGTEKEPNTGEEVTEADVNAAIQTANYCEEDEDCTNIGSTCPFGCYIAVNSAEAESVQALIDEWLETNSECDYDCPAMTGLTCGDEGTCIVTAE